jgi:hypothetical protein
MESESIKYSYHPDEQTLGDLSKNISVVENLNRVGMNDAKVAKPYQGNGWKTVEERIKTEIPDANLWRAVIEQAVEDLSQPKLRQAAVDWFTSSAQGPGIFAGLRSPRSEPFGGMGSVEEGKRVGKNIRHA